MRMMIEWPVIKDNWSKEKKEKIIKDRVEIAKYVDFLYSNRSVIKLKKYRSIDRAAFLNLSVFCITCKKRKKLWRFYDIECDIVNDSCGSCKQKQEIYETLKGII